MRSSRAVSAGATISDVAEAAGVSRATVSRVMNGLRGEDEITRRVREVAERLAYRPSATARSLSLGRTLAVGVVVPDLANPMFQAVLRAVTDGAYRSGYGVVIAETAGRDEREVDVVRATRARCDALVLVSPQMSEQALEAAADELGPLVLVNRSLPGSRIPSVNVDYAEAMYTVLEHLVELGHGSIAYLQGPASSPSNRARLEGVDEAQVSFGGTSLVTLPCGPTVADGYAAAEAVLATRATAVVAYNDQVAFGLLAHLGELGVSVPEDVSVVGFDDIELARYAAPSLTTVRVPHDELGAHAWERLSALVAGTSATADDHESDTRTEILPTQLVVRASSGPAPAGSATPVAVARRTPQPDGLAWVVDGADTVLAAGESRLARYREGASMADVHAPRPHLHPVRSLAGTRITAASPADRRHHHGLSLALQDVAGSNFWGGRTCVPGEGMQVLGDQGRQVRVAVEVADGRPGRLLEQLEWHGRDGEVLLDEARTLDGELLEGGAGWALRWSSELTARRALRISNPAEESGSLPGYGGVFWRFAPADEHRVASSLGSGDVAHGSRSPWLVVAARHGTAWTTVVLVQDRGRPWFVRTTPYLGAGPAVASGRPIDLAEGHSLAVRLAAVVLDGLHSPSAVAERWYPFGARLLAEG
ncbi:DUF6807 family protein [Sanguibacter sp. HDW7]|uniref:DUF6807 family protein n=1 Tax=Sanguibacter sp. HDW7 TaxID=2714931 RepID=UPI001F0FDE7B|nr:DUF6807 family protein [Sanguibacter sp. HDW7]